MQDLFNAVKEQLPLGMATSEKECFTSSLPEKYFAALLLLGMLRSKYVAFRCDYFMSSQTF